MIGTAMLASNGGRCKQHTRSIEDIVGLLD